MALVIEGGISIGGNIAITAEFYNPVNTLVVFYDAGNSMCYSGSGINFVPGVTGPGLNGYAQGGVLDLAGLTGGPWNSGAYNGANASIGWTSQGVASYWTLDAADTQYINSTYQTEAPTLTSATYSIVAVVRPQDFTTGAIVGGDENIFYFQPNGGLNDGPSLVANNAYAPGGVVDSTTAFETDTWYCVAVTYDADADTMKLYTNGVQVDSITGVGAITAPTGLFWGTLEGQLWFTGDLAVCMAYERVISDSEVGQLSDVYLSRYIAPPATSSIVFTQPIIGSPTWTVPEGVTSISVVAVGAGGGGTEDSYSPPGGDTIMARSNNAVNIVPTTITNTGSEIAVNSTAYPSILNVTAGAGWVVTGSDIAGAVPAFDLVTAVASDGGDPTLIVITINNTITTTAGDTFSFYQAVAAAEGGYEINTSYYNQYNTDLDAGPPGGPGARAQALVTDGPYGAGGVVDWTDFWPIGGGGAGGYGIAGLAWNINQAGEWLYITVGPGGDAYHTMSFSNNNLTVNGLVGSTNAGVETTVIGTQTIAAGAKVMYSLTIDQVSGVTDYCGVGLSNYNQNLWNYIGSSDFNSVGYYDNGSVNFNGSVVETYAPFTTGSIIDIAVNMISGYAWFRVDGGLWNNNPAADPVFIPTSGFDISSLLSQNSPISVAASPWYNSGTSTADIITIATTSAYTVPEGYTFVPGVAGAGGSGGDGAADYGLTAMPGTGGSSGGGGARTYDSGAGGGGTGLYGRGTSGTAGTWVDTDINSAGIALGGGGGSDLAAGYGGQATPWNGGRGGWPGGGGASATGYWDGGNGGALAYRNNYAVTPGDTYLVVPGVGGLGQNDGGSGANGAIRIVWPGDTRQFPATNVGPDEVAVPTLDITAHTFPANNPTGSITFDITNTGGSTILEAGVVYGLPGQTTYLDSTDTCDGASSTAERTAIRLDNNCANPYTTGLTGSQTISFNTFQFVIHGDTIDVCAYARNEAGVAYSATTLTWTPGICLAAGTLVTLADNSTKAIEDITMSDLIQVWDFDLGQYASAVPLWIKRQESTVQYNLIKFSDGSELKTISQHRIFNKQAGAFTYPMTDDTPVGTVTVKADGSEVSVISKQVVYEAVDYYNVVTAGGHMNLYANGILTSLRYNNIYPIADMQYIKDGRTLRDRSEFAGIADRWIDGLRLTEQTIDIKHIRKYVDRLERNEAQEPTTRTLPAWQRQAQELVLDLEYHWQHQQVWLLMAQCCIMISAILPVTRVVALV